MFRNNSLKIDPLINSNLQELLKEININIDVDENLSDTQKTAFELFKNGQNFKFSQTSSDRAEIWWTCASGRGMKNRKVWWSYPTGGVGRGPQNFRKFQFLTIFRSRRSNGLT